MEGSVEMIKFLIKFCVIAVSAKAAQGSSINDAVCDTQLSYFDQALTDREFWAVYGEQQKRKTKKNISKIISFKYLTRGQKSRTVCCEEI